jgi:signal transduction histidine kinase
VTIGVRRSATLGSTRIALAQLAIAALLLGVILIGSVSVIRPPGPPTLRMLSVVVGWVWIGAGLLAWVRRPSNRLGPVITAGGFVMLLGSSDATGVPVLAALATAVGSVPLAVLVHVLHAFPSGRLPSRASRLTVLAGYLVSLVLQAPLWLFTVDVAPYDLLFVADRPDLVQLGRWVQSAAGAAVMVATTAILAARLRRASSPSRRTLGPLYGYGILAVVLSPLIPNVLAPRLGLPFEWWFGTQLLILAGVPVAFTVSLLRGGFARTGEIEELSTWLAATDGGRGPLADALARALGDRSLRLLFWMPDRDRYVDADGADAVLPANRERGTVEVTRGGRRIAAIDYDRALNADPGPVRAAGRVVAIAMDHERVTAALRASQLALRRSRARIIEAGDAERRRIARDLHDGLQMRMVLLAVQAQMVVEELDAPPDVRAAMTALRVEIDSTAADLRGMVHAVMPAALIEGGLGAAAEDLVDRLPVSTRLEVDLGDRTLPTAVEHTAYFVVAEAVTNALKHAQPTQLTVELIRSTESLRVRVEDNGSGGADVTRGTGLRGLADRVDTLGGRLLVHSAVDGGTRVVAELPCGS